jgi:hypothetical protein
MRVGARVLDNATVAASVDDVLRATPSRARARQADDGRAQSRLSSSKAARIDEFEGIEGIEGIEWPEY